MSQLTIGFDGQTAPLVIEGGATDIRRFVAQYEKFTAGEDQGQKRFIFRMDQAVGEEPRRTTTYIDLHKVVWLSIEDQPQGEKAGARSGKKR
jgi:hypothetical protein